MTFKRVGVLRTTGIAVLATLASLGGTPMVAAAEQAPRAESRSVWDQLARCESGGDWSINTGNGYYGGLQFSRSTWRSYGGGDYASYPHHASKAQQIDIATRVRDDRGGYGAWPSCAGQLGLPV